MTGGIDRGPCWWYSRLSYRRKLIRTLWITPLAFALAGVTYLYGPSLAFIPASLFLPLMGAAAIGQIGYNWFRWSRESLAD